MKNRFRVLFCVVALAALSGCNEDAKIQKAIPQPVDKTAREFITAIEKKNFEQARSLVAAPFRAEAEPSFKKMSEVMEKGKLEELKPIGIRGRENPKQKMYLLTYQIKFPKDWVLANIAILEEEGKVSVASAQVQPMTQSVEQAYAFKLGGKPLRNYLLMILTLIVPVFVFYTLVQCIRMKIGYKWLWIPFIAIGIGSVHLDWNGGRVFIQPFSFLIFCVGFYKTKYGPLIMSFGIPVGALVFFFKYLFKKPR